MKALTLFMKWLLLWSLVEAGEVEFQMLVTKMEGDVLELRDYIQDLYAGRCNVTTIEKCSKSNYDNCYSLYPNQTCRTVEQGLLTDACGDGTRCSGLADYTISTVRLPSSVADGPNNNPTDRKVIETVCFTQRLDEWFINKYETDKAFWSDSGVPSPQMHYGANNGVFRIYPARQSTTCGWFDPRERPWYVAGSSGPKNIVLILDTSGSMEGRRLELMKQAAKQVVQRLAVGDRVAIVPFASSAAVFARDGRFLYTATAENKELLLEQIDSLEANGETNFQDAFQKAFQVMIDSIEFYVNCNTAFLFLTDGEMNQPDGVTEADVMELVSSGISDLENRLGKPAFLFTYSISENDDVHIFPKELACATNGVWDKIVDDREIVESLTSYYLLFALGLGASGNENFTAWVEPFFFDNTDVLGITVSAPVYDRSESPPLFLGVAAIGSTLTAVSKALGVLEGSQAAIDRVVLTSTARCPALNLTTCELESYRRRGSAAEGALCSSNCSDLVTIADKQCPNTNEYPKNLWANLNNMGKSFVERTCCPVDADSDISLDECAAEAGKSMVGTGGIIGISVGAVVVFIGVMFLFRRYRAIPSFIKSGKALDEKTTQSQDAYPMPVPQTPFYGNRPPPSAPIAAND